jgi:nucleoside-diphosphate-sugar epimerase
MKFLVFGGSGFIGIHLVRELKSEGHVVLVADLIKNQSINTDFHQVDLRNYSETLEVIRDFTPEIVVNLASKTDDYGVGIFDYSTNFLGPLHINRAIKACQLTESTHYFHFSSQYVVKPTSELENCFTDYDPYTIYGESKALGELILRNETEISWTIFRPTAVWGEYHPSFPTGVWPLISRRLFTMPKRSPIRSYIYVGTLTNQFVKFLDISRSKTRHEIFYLGNSPYRQDILFDEFSKALTGKPIRKVPIQILSLANYFFKCFSLFGLKAPISQIQFEILTQNYEIEISKTEDLIGKSEENLVQSVEKTITWYKENSKLGTSFK